MEEVVPKRSADAAAQMRYSLVGGDLDPVEDVRKRCKKNYPSVLSYIDKRTREGCDRGSEVGTVHSDVFLYANALEST